MRMMIGFKIGCLIGFARSNRFHQLLIFRRVYKRLEDVFACDHYAFRMDTKT